MYLRNLPPRCFEIDLPTLSEARTKVFNASSMNE